MIELTKEEISDEILIYRFKTVINVISNILKRLKAFNLSLNYHISFVEKKEQIGLSIPDQKSIEELIVVMGDVLKPNSDLYYSVILNKIEKLNQSNSIKKVLLQFETHYQEILTSGIDLTLNDKNFTSEKAYYFILSKVLEIDDTIAIENEKKMNENPVLGKMVWFKAYSFAFDMGQLLLWIYRVFNKENLFPKLPSRKNHCIYCLTTLSDFSTNEHTIPHSLGNYDSVLPLGWVCDPCQNNLSSVESKFLETLPFALIKIYTMRYTKQGKFPAVKFANIHLTKVRPNVVKIKNFAGKRGEIKEIEKIGDEIRFQLPPVSKDRDHRIISRVLLKAALGITALEKGRKYVLDSKFNAIRDHIHKNKPFNGKLLIQRTTNNIKGEMKMSFFPNDEIAVFDIFGINILISLQPGSFPPPPLNVLEELTIYDLNQQTDESIPANYHWLENEYENAIMKNPESPELWFNLAHVYHFQLANYIQAERSYLASLFINSYSHETWFKLGDLYQNKLDRFSDSEFAFKSGLNLDPSHPRVWYNLGHLYQFSLNKITQAEDAYRETVKLLSQHERAWLNLGVILKKTKRYEEAAEAYENAIKSNPSSYMAYNNLALLEVARGNLPKAVERFKKSVDIHPKYLDGWQNLGFTNFEMKQYSEAEHALKEYLKYKPKNIEILLLLGTVLIIQEKYNEAESKLKFAENLDPTNSAIFANLGLLHLNQNHFQESEYYLFKTLEKNHDDPVALYNIACLFAKQGDVTRSCEFLTRSIQVSSKYLDLAMSDSDFDSIRDNDDFQRIAS